MKLIKSILLSPFNVLYKFNPQMTIKLIFFIKFRKRLNLKKPVTYNEKIQYLKLKYRNNLMPICADKYTVRNYVKQCGLEYILNDILWEGFEPEDIPFEKLPDKFVIKVTHGSGHNIICKDKRKLDTKKTIKKLKKWLKLNFIPCYGEWFYGIVKPRIIIEKFLSEDGESVPEDYKMFYFNNYNGKKDVALTAIDTDRFTYHKRKIYDNNWKLLANATITFPYEKVRDFDKPKNYEEMVKYAKILARPFPHARVDFYIINDNIYFGEITFTSDAGFGKIKPESLNINMGDWINIESL